jgi:ABC-type dipeptide/oligopeptide/nickel transport system permease subunit
VRLSTFFSRVLNPRADLSRLRNTRTSPSKSVTPGDAPLADEMPERHIRLRHILFNVPLLFGGLIVLVLFAGVLFGPVLAPENPYLRGRRILEYRDGAFYSPPFPPSIEHPMGTDELGRDTLSMLLYGARNTLVAAAFITMARLTLGLALGGSAGWNENTMTDRVVMGIVQMLASLPMLLVAMILILALDIRRGLPVFIIALCSIGWGEIAQYIRAEFIRIKQEPYLDSGRVIGLTPLGLAIRHVLPNVLPTLIVITLLEMGAALMILGELGFIGIYVGGGISIQVDDFNSRQFFAVPEWGAMMAGSRAWARSRPWMVMFPAIAFFVSVTGFNLLGEGLRRLMDRGVFNTALLLSWRVLVAVAIVTAASIYVILTLGPAPSYQNLAQQVSEADLMRHVEFLSAPEMNGRVAGSPEAYRAAEYIAAELESYGLSAPPGGWIQKAPVTLARLTEPPELSLLDENGRTLTTFTRLADYGESIERHGGSGLAEAPITLVLFSPSSIESAERFLPEEVYESFRGLDLRGRTAMIIAGNALPDFETEALIRGAEGVLIVSSDVKPRNQALSDYYMESPSLPMMRITPQAADQILARAGISVEQAQEATNRLGATGLHWAAEELEVQVRMNLQFAPPETVILYNVMGLLNGSDATLADELVIVSSHYDGLGRAADGTLYPGANGNASGVAVMLEVARLWQEQEFQPRRSVLFVAWAGGELPYSGAHYFRDRRGGFITHYDISSVIHLDRLGGAAGDGLVVRPLGRRNIENHTLFNLLVSSADRMEVAVTQGLAMRHHYQQTFTGQFGDSFGTRYGTLIVTWGDPEPTLADDSVENIDLEHLSRAAQVINLTLITAAHEPRF